MSLIKKALDKAQAEHRQKDSEPTPEASSPYPGVTPSRAASASGREAPDGRGLRLVLWSALIVLLSILIGGQLVWLITIFLL